MNPNKVIQDAAKKLGFQSHVQSIWTNEPVLEELTATLAQYIGTHCVAESGAQLIETAIKEAVTSYREALSAGETEGMTRGKYIRALLLSGTEIFDQHIVVSTKTGDILWSPFVSGLSDFLDKYPNCEVTVRRKASNVGADIKTIFLMTKIIPPSLLDTDSLAELLDEVKLTA